MSKQQTKSESDAYWLRLTHYLEPAFQNLKLREIKNSYRLIFLVFLRTTTAAEATIKAVIIRPAVGNSGIVGDGVGNEASVGVGGSIVGVGVVVFVGALVGDCVDAGGFVGFEVGVIVGAVVGVGVGGSGVGVGVGLGVGVGVGDGVGEAVGVAVGEGDGEGVGDGVGEGVGVGVPPLEAPFVDKLNAQSVNESVS